MSSRCSTFVCLIKESCLVCDTLLVLLIIIANIADNGLEDVILRNLCWFVLEEARLQAEQEQREREERERQEREERERLRQQVSYQSITNPRVVFTRSLCP